MSIDRLASVAIVAGKAKLLAKAAKAATNSERPITPKMSHPGEGRKPTKGEVNNERHYNTTFVKHATELGDVDKTIRDGLLMGIHPQIPSQGGVRNRASTQSCPMKGNTDHLKVQSKLLTTEEQAIAELEEKVGEMLRGHPELSTDQAIQGNKTLHAVYKTLLEGSGGAIVVVCETKAAQDLQIDYLDGGKALQIFIDYARNVHHKQEEFKTLMDSFSRHTDSDRWESWLTSQLATELGAAPERFRELIGEAKDGGVVLSLNGTVLAVAARLRHLNKYRIVKGNGRGAGTRHSAALGVAEWMGNNTVTGIVFVRSDGGDVTAMCPTTPGQAPYTFTLRNMSEMESDTDHFVDESDLDHHSYRPRFLKAFGLMPSAINPHYASARRILIILMCVLGVGVNLSNLWGRLCPGFDYDRWDRAHMMDLTFSVGMLLCVLSFPSDARVTKIVGISEAWAKRNDFERIWSKATLLTERRILCIWLLAVVVRGVLWLVGTTLVQWLMVGQVENSVLEKQQGCGADALQLTFRIMLDMFAFFWNSGVFAAMVLYVYYILGAMSFSRNYFVQSVAKMTEYEKTILDWNMIQAFFFELSTSVQTVFVGQILSIALAIFCFARERAIRSVFFTTTTQFFVPILMLVALSGHLLVSSANLTEACQRAPSVINSLMIPGGKVMDQKRHYLVEYVKYSDPGFRVFGCLITRITLVSAGIGFSFTLVILLLVNLWYGLNGHDAGLDAL
jgi:hypothetical protein